jgi:ectoine hydroxylase-related dioxygenase (phytanoyl-CoA dioxygenase family)
VSAAERSATPRYVNPDVGRGWEIYRGQIPPSAVDTALRRIHVDILQNGLPTESVGVWIRSMHWFPHLKWEPEITALADHLPPALRDGEMCDPQIILQLPDVDEEVELVSHVDRAPEWAAGRPYTCIAGVALTPSRPTNGGLVVWPLDGSEPTALELAAGDVLAMDPDLPHASGLNAEGIIRYAVYFRYLQR